MLHTEDALSAKAKQPSNMACAEQEASVPMSTTGTARPTAAATGGASLAAVAAVASVVQETTTAMSWPDTDDEAIEVDNRDYVVFFLAKYAGSPPHAPHAPHAPHGQSPRPF